MRSKIFGSGAIIGAASIMLAAVDIHGLVFEKFGPNIRGVAVLIALRYGAIASKRSAM